MQRADGVVYRIQLRLWRRRGGTGALPRRCTGLHTTYSLEPSSHLFLNRNLIAIGTWMYLFREQRAVVGSCLGTRHGRHRWGSW